MSGAEAKWYDYGAAFLEAQLTPGLTELVEHDCDPPTPKNVNASLHYTCPLCGTSWVWNQPAARVDYPFLKSKENLEDGWWFCANRRYQVKAVS